MNREFSVQFLTESGVSQKNRITEKLESRTGHQECAPGAEVGGFSHSSLSGRAMLSAVTVLYQGAV